jgi:hypothetical protein
MPTQIFQPNYKKDLDKIPFRSNYKNDKKSLIHPFQSNCNKNYKIAIKLIPNPFTFGLFSLLRQVRMQVLTLLEHRLVLAALEANMDVATMASLQRMQMVRVVLLQSGLTARGANMDVVTMGSLQRMQMVRVALLQALNRVLLALVVQAVNMDVVRMV